MNRIARFAILGCALLFSQCKTTAPTAPVTDIPSVVQAVHLLDTAQRRFLEFADSAHGNPRQALEMTADYLFFVPNVKYVYTVDSTYIRIILNSGLETTFSYVIVDSAGKSRYRGGSSSLPLKPQVPAILPPSANTITSKKVLFFAADTKSLPAVEAQLQKGIGRIDTSGLSLEITVLRDEQCRFGLVESFKDYGLVFIDTHGERDGFLTGPTLDFTAVQQVTEEGMKSVVDAQLGAGAYGKIVAGELRLGYGIRLNPAVANWQNTVEKEPHINVFFTSKFLNMLPPMPNTVIMGNMCYSGWINTAVHYPKKYVEYNGKVVTQPETTIVVDAIAQAFMNRNPISYYGYARNAPPGTSRAVPDEFAAECENSLIKGLVTDLDSTGMAHRSSVSNIEFFDPEHPIDGILGDLYFRHFGADDYSYCTCVDTFTDARDGQKYKVVCIGRQTWMAENLNYNAPGTCYEESSENCTAFGKLYDWKTMMKGEAPSSANPSKVRGICPKGWHIPSMSEWVDLILFADSKAAGGHGGYALRSKSLWSKAGGTDTLGFDGRPGGEYDPVSGYGNVFKSGSWWSSTKIASADKYEYMFLTLSASAAHFYAAPETKYSCRCLKD
jgi:uncharacterized protein (TIGR02145 family)